MIKIKGFTITEVIIACSVFSIFLIGLLSLYSSGSKMGNATMWLQNTANQLKSATRQINTSIRKSSYPSCFTFPQKIEENNNDCFKLRYLNKKLMSSECNQPTIFLVSIESTPAKKGFQTGNQDLSLTYHIFSLDNNGNLYYSRKEFATNNYDSLPNTIPNSNPTYKTTLVKDVESIECSKKRKDTRPQPIEIKINCVMPKSVNTKRTEVAVGTPNVDLNPVAAIN